MARKSRKHQYTEMFRPSTANAVGYVRLSVANQEEFNSIQNQKFIIERWGDQHQIPISHYYYNNFLLMQIAQSQDSYSLINHHKFIFRLSWMKNR